MTSVLQLKNVSYAYPHTIKKVVKNVNISFENGKLYCIMGKSGAGKSTLLSLISGLDLASGGDLLCDGINIKEVNRDKYRRENIGIIFQGYNLLTTATALENVELSMNISGVKIGEKKERALELLKQVGIDKESAKRKVLKLSGGEQQRIAIARAIAHDPKIIIADEPTGNLDDSTRKIIMDILTKLAHEQDKCVIIVTHSKSVAGYADELWGLNQGNIVFVK